MIDVSIQRRPTSYIILMFLLLISIQVDADTGKRTCEMSDVQKALGAMLCQDKAFLSGDCGINMGMEVGAAGVGAALGAYGANYMQLKFLMRDVAEYATIQSFLKNNTSYIDGAGARIQNGALGGSETGTTRSVDAAAFRGIQDSFQDDIEGIKADNEVYRRRLAAIEEKAKRLGITDMNARVRDFEKAGFLESFTRNKPNGDVDTRKRYRLNSSAARHPGKTRALARALGAGIGMTMATPLAGAVIGALVLEAPIFAYQYFDARNDSECAASFGDVSRYLEADASGFASSGQCSLTGNFDSDFEEFFKLSQDEQDRLLANPDFCDGLRKAYSLNEISPDRIAGFRCETSAANRSGRRYSSSVTVYTETTGRDGVTRLAPIRFGYNGRAVSEIVTDYYNTVDFQGQPSFDLVSGAARNFRSEIDIHLEFNDRSDPRRFTRARMAHFTDINGTTQSSWQLANSVFATSAKSTPSGERLRDVAIFKENYDSVLKEIGAYCLNDGNGSNIPEGIAGLEYGPPDSWNDGQGHRSVARIQEN